VDHLITQRLFLRVLSTAVSFALLGFFIIGCNPTAIPVADRLGSIPSDATKITPEMDENPPISLSDEYDFPIPLPGSVNTAGGEDSLFITPDVRLPAEQQLGDGVTGIYVSSRNDDGWGEVSRVLLQEPDRLALDGCAFVAGDVIWFCSTREGYSGINWFTAESIDGRWQKWEMVNFDPSFQVGELHLSMDGREMFFASNRAGGSGGLDIWVSESVGGIWQTPEPVTAVNTAANEGWPALSPDGSQLWFSRDYGIWRSLKVNDLWQAPEEIIAPLAGEPTIDQAGNVYFVHHFFSGDTMLEVDIYLAYRK